MISEETRKKINVLKTLAMLSVICAHCNTVNENAALWNNKIHLLLNGVGTIGVGVFFTVSGYLFSYGHKSGGGENGKALYIKRQYVF